MSTSAAPTAARRGRPARYTLDELLDVVVTEFNVRGYDATSMEDLARATGLTKAALYHHVAGKEEFLRLAVSRGVDALESVVDEGEALDAPAVARLEHVLRRSVEVLVEQLPFVTLLLRVRGNTPAEQEALRRRRELDARVAALVHAAVDEGDLRDDLDPRLVTRLLFGAVNSLVEWYRPGRGTSGPAVADTLVTVVLDGMRPRDSLTGSSDGRTS
ncbi:MAG: TetR/AcrR family transcriptional regulator [Motilibacteraceae bacterium]